MAVELHIKARCVELIRATAFDVLGITLEQRRLKSPHSGDTLAVNKIVPAQRALHIKIKR